MHLPADEEAMALDAQRPADGPKDFEIIIVTKTVTSAPSESPLSPMGLASEDDARGEDPDGR